MTDNPLPSPHTAPAPQVLRVTEVVQPGSNGAPARPAPADDSKTGFVEVLRYYGLYVAVLAGVWAVVFGGLLLFGFLTSEGFGFATVAVIVASFFVRSVVPGLAEKPGAARDLSNHTTDSAREIIETVVFVVVLVLLLKSYTAEAFVIPTGSMAESLWGYQKVVECPQCKLKFPVNCSSEVDPSDGSPPIPVEGCTCPSCRLDITLLRPGQPAGNAARAGAIRDPGWRSGDRVLVAKFVYDLLDRDPDRLDVVVFKFPGDRAFPDSGPVKRHVPINYIKRLIGEPGETIGIHRGKLWVLAADKGPQYDDVERAGGKAAAAMNLWKPEFMHHDDEQALKRFRDGVFAIVRKKPENLLSMRRLVYDNDHQAQDLPGPGYQRWLPVADSGWEAVGKETKEFQAAGSGEKMGWLRYRHVLRDSPDRPRLITDFMGYNTWSSGLNGHRSPSENWVSDLMVECEVAVEGKTGTFALELSRGPDRFQAVFNVEDGKCTLYRVQGEERMEMQSKEMQSAATKLVGKGTYAVRFANMDDRLTVWVNEKLAFGAGVEYGPVRSLAPTKENDLERPVSVGSSGAKVKVSKLKVFRDTYYTTGRGDRPSDADVPEFKANEPETWSGLAKGPVSTYYVQPGHYLCLGDNSPESSDGRSWGVVPRRLLLGRAMVVYYPFGRAGLIR